MPAKFASNMTEQQRQWFASLRDGLQRDTGKSLAEWVSIAKQCPEVATRARLKWFKDSHGLLQNRAMQVLAAAFPTTDGSDEPAALRSALWSDEESLAILEAVEKLAAGLSDVTPTQRKNFSAWSRTYQFAALRPVRGGMARLGLALPPDADASLQAAKKEGWSERLKAAIVLASPRDADPHVASLLRAAWKDS